jgi:hypothetical protein
MLNFFHSIFKGFEQTGGYPNDLLEAAIERAVDGTDPSLRAVSGYRRKLRPAVLAAIDHVVTLVDGFTPPRLATRDSYSHDPLLQAIFLSSEQMIQVLHSQLSAQPTVSGEVCALLVMDMQQRGIFGADLQGSTVVRDVPQVTVSFANHRLLDPSSDEKETRHLLKRRAFDHLLKMALRRMAATREIREDLDQRLTLLQAKHDALHRGNWGFNAGRQHQPDEIVELDSQLAEIESQLQAIGTDDQSIDIAMKLLVDVLGRPQQYLWMSRQSLVVDHMGIKRGKSSEDAPELLLEQVQDAEGRSVVVTLVRSTG